MTCACRVARCCDERGRERESASELLCGTDSMPKGLLDLLKSAVGLPTTQTISNAGLSHYELSASWSEYLASKVG